MGVKQSKRSVDITETSTKGEIEGFGNEGKVEKIIDGVLEKVAANGHVDGDLQNGIDSLQNGVDPLQNGEAAAVATEKVSEVKSGEELPIEGTVNGEVNGEADKSEEGKKSDEKKDKKKDKKEKVVKKKFSFRNFSFSKKDKSKPMKEEKSTEKVEESVKEEAMTTPDVETSQPSQEQLAEPPKPEEVSNTVVEVSVTEGGFTVEKQEVVVPEVPELPKVPEVEAPEKVAEVVSKVSDDLPPPLPASPPPSEPIEGKLVTDRMDMSESMSTFSSGEVLEVGGSFSNILAEEMKSSEGIKNAEQIAIETGKQIEEKATNLLKTVEERAEESMRGIGETEKTEESNDGVQNVLGDEIQTETKEVQKVLGEEDKLTLETVATVPVEISNVEELTAKAEDSTEKANVADVPVDIACCEPKTESKDIYDI